MILRAPARNRRRRRLQRASPDYRQRSSATKPSISQASPCGQLEIPSLRHTHPLLGDELRALLKLNREAKSPFIFVSERGVPFSVSGLQKLIERAGIEAKLSFKVHPHMLRHSTGYALANKGIDSRTLQAYLGHRSIQSTCGTPSSRLAGLKIFGARTILSAFAIGRTLAS
jgi:integrase-like protein